MAEQIDPRYDPAFQRGYDGPVATGSRAAAAARRTAPHVTSALQRSVAEPAEPRVAAAGPIQPQPVVATPETETDAASAPVVHVAAPALRAPWTNPFAILVTLVGVVVLAIGVWLLQEAYQLTQSPDGLSNQADYWFMQAGMVAGPIFAGLGVAVLVAVLMFCAVYWARRPGLDEHD